MSRANEDVCCFCGAEMEDWGAHGAVCPRCEESVTDADDHRSHFSRGYSEGERDAATGSHRALVTADGDDPSVVKADDSAYYHGYKAAVEGVASSEESAWAAYVAKHAMRANVQAHTISSAEVSGLPVGSILWNDGGWVVVPGGVAPIAILTERAGGPVPAGESAESIAPEFALVRGGTGRVPTHGTAQRHVIGWHQGGRTVPNPLHLKLDGTFAFGIGTADDKQMRTNARRPSARRAEPSASGEVEVLSVVFRGIEAAPLRLGVAVSPGAPNLRFTGEAIEANKVREISVRVQSALVQIGSRLDGAVTVSAPDGAMQGSAGLAGLDLPIALGVLANQGRVPAASLRGVMVLGELSLDGAVRPVRGAAVAAVGAEAAGANLLVVPDGNEIEARFSGRVPVMSFRTLAEVVEFMQRPEVPHEPPLAFAPCPEREGPGGNPGLPAGAIEAARSGQGILLVGPPGAGKTMAARYLRSVLPPLTREEALELTLIYSAAGLLQDNYACARPFRAPHHSVSDAGLVGGGKPVRPGEVTLAHRGVLFLDELPEFRRSAIDALASALREGAVRVRDGGLPAAPFVVVAAANPCPCGYAGTSRACKCSAAIRARYDERLIDAAQHLGLHRFDLAPLTVGQMQANAQRQADIGFSDLVLQRSERTGTYFVTRAGVSAPELTVTAGHEEPVDALDEAVRVHPYETGVVYVLGIADGELSQIGNVMNHRFVPGGSDTMKDVGRHVEWATGYEANMHEPNARKNVSSVINAFLAGRRHSEKTCSTDGWRLYSYSMLIAARVDAQGEPADLGAPGARVVVLDKSVSPSATTSSQIKAVLDAVPGAQVVEDMPFAARYAKNARKGQFKTPAGLTPAEAFFFEHSGYSYKTGASPAEQKRARIENAKASAAAEAEGESRGWTVEWEYDENPDVSGLDEEALEELQRGATEILVAVLKDENGEVLGSLGGVHVNARGDRDPYSRVVEAELMQEALAAEDSAGRAMALNPSRRQARPNWRMILDLPGVEKRLGADHVADILASQHPQATASSRARGWWDANEPGLFEAYNSLARMIEDGELDDLIAETRATR